MPHVHLKYRMSSQDLYLFLTNSTSYYTTTYMQNLGHSVWFFATAAQCRCVPRCSSTLRARARMTPQKPRLARHTALRGEARHERSAETEAAPRPRRDRAEIAPRPHRSARRAHIGSPATLSRSRVTVTLPLHYRYITVTATLSRSRVTLREHSIFRSR